MERVWLRWAVAVFLTASADYLVFGVSAGIGLSLFAVLLSAVAAWRFGRRLLRAGPWLALWGVMVFAPAVQASTIGRLTLIAVGWTILAMALEPGAPTLFAGFARGIVGGVRSLGAAPVDLRRIALVWIHRDGAAWRSPWWVVGLPAGLVVLFALLIIPANLVLSRWIMDALDAVGRWIGRIEVGRPVFWLLIGLAAYGVVRFRLGSRPRAAARAAGLSEDRRNNELRACVLTLMGLNALYLLANLADLFYLWLAFEPPEGVTYSQFAHQGSYRLIVAVVLAAVAVPAFFRLHTLQSTDPRARRQGTIFIAQNLVVLLGAARRLQLYVEVYGLTRFRMATLLWLALVFAGFVLIWIKVAHNRPFRYLLETNARTTALLLAAVSVLNLDGLIADWNVARFEDGSAETVDVGYLADLEEGGLPALARLSKTSRDPRVAEQAQAAFESVRARQEALHSPWQAWTWARAAALR